MAPRTQTPIVPAALKGRWLIVFYPPAKRALALIRWQYGLGAKTLAASRDAYAVAEFLAVLAAHKVENPVELLTAYLRPVLGKTAYVAGLIWEGLAEYHLLNTADQLNTAKLTAWVDTLPRLARRHPKTKK